MLGCDPYALTDQESTAINDVSNKLPETIIEEFYSTVTIEDVSNHAKALNSFAGEVWNNSKVIMKQMQELRGKIQNIDPKLKLWDQGYKFAQELRHKLSIGDVTVRSSDQYADIFKLDKNDWKQACNGGYTNLNFLEAAMAVNSSGSPHFYTNSTKQHEASKTFALGRAIFEFLNSSSEEPIAIVSESYSEKQKRNRAFAAEFLAPKSLIQQKLKSEYITDSTIQSISDEFGVSNMVIKHQIENHGLAHIL